jgi:hypothetical protein
MYVCTERLSKQFRGTIGATTLRDPWVQSPSHSGVLKIALTASHSKTVITGGKREGKRREAKEAKKTKEKPLGIILNDLIVMH